MEKNIQDKLVGITPGMFLKINNVGGPYRYWIDIKAYYALLLSCEYVPAGVLTGMSYVKYYYLHKGIVEWCTVYDTEDFFNSVVHPNG